MLISVVIPCFNAEAWLGEAIESALDQNGGYDIEIVVANDGSTDASVKVAEGFGSHVNCVSQPNRGASAARNLGLRHARGDIVQFLDADDLLHGSRFSLMLRAWEKKPEANFVAATIQSIGVEEIKAADFLHASIVMPNTELRDDALSTSYLPCIGLFRRSFLDSIGDWDETLTRWVDLEYHVRIAARGNEFPYLPAKLYGYRHHDGPQISRHNKTYTNLDDALRSLRLAESHFIGNSKLPPERMEYFFEFYIHLARGYAQAGDRTKFALMLRKAAAVSSRAGFRQKARAADAFARLFGVRATSGIIERFLPPAA